MFRQLTSEEVNANLTSATVDAETLKTTADIIESVRKDGDAGLLNFARQFDGYSESTVEVYDPSRMQEAHASLPDEQKRWLQNLVNRVQTFAEQQKASLADMEMKVAGGRCGHEVLPIKNVGCYAPGGRYPLPSSVVMTAAVARTAGCSQVVVTSPNASPIMLAAAHASGADLFFPFGGPHAIAALAYGTETIERIDMIAGPGNRWVTAAKKLVFGQVGIDMLAGPSELLVIADQTASPIVIAADLIAQAEHDNDARTLLITTEQSIGSQVAGEIEKQLENLPTAETARASLAHGGFLVVETIEQAIKVANRVAAEHLQIQCEDSDDIASKIEHAGCIFVGNQTAEVFGDYGIGPNHTLPTSTTARYRGGLSVFDFLRTRTWIRLDQADPDMQQQMASIAKLEGLIGHQRACLIERP